MSAILNRPRQEPDWIIPGLLKRQNILFMIGPPKKGKSWLLLNLAWDLAEGRPIWGIERSREGGLFVAPRPMRVLYFAQEDTEDDLQDRLTLMKCAGRVPNDFFWLAPKNLGMMLDTPAGIMEIEGIISDASPVDLVIFDPFRRMLRGDENSSAVTAGLWRQLDEWGRKFKCAFAFSHHIVKPPHEKGSKFDETSPFAGRGSGDIFAGGAFVNVVPAPVHTAMAKSHPLRLHFQTKRAAPIAPVNLRLDIPPGTVSFQGFATGRPVSEMMA
jgi:RecA-family ATPase